MKKVSLFRQPDGEIRLGDCLKNHLGDPKKGWTEFRAAVAFAKRSGIRHLLPELEDFAKRAAVTVSIGIDLRGTSHEGLQILLDTVAAVGGEIWIFHNRDEEVRPTFHPKIYLFKKPGSALLIVGSGNLTAGGLFSNYEAGIALELDLEHQHEAAILKDVESALNAWCDPNQGLALRLSKDLLARLVADGTVPPEAKARGDAPSQLEDEGAAQKPQGPPLFGKIKVRRPPPLKKSEPPKPKLTGAGFHRGFLMTLQQTDAGVGQATAGASRRSPEIFVPLAARDEDPSFWGWPSLFQKDASNPGKHDRFGVRMQLGGSITNVNMMTWPAKHDFRLRSETLRSAGKVGDILRIERAAAGSGFTYYVEIIPRGTSEYGKRLAQCIHAVRNSKKRYGYY